MNAIDCKLYALGRALAHANIALAAGRTEQAGRAVAAADGLLCQIAMEVHAADDRQAAFRDAIFGQSLAAASN